MCYNFSITSIMRVHKKRSLVIFIFSLLLGSLVYITNKTNTINIQYANNNKLRMKFTTNFHESNLPFDIHQSNFVASKAIQHDGKILFQPLQTRRDYETTKINMIKSSKRISQTIFPVLTKNTKDSLTTETTMTFPTTTTTTAAIMTTSVTMMAKTRRKKIMTATTTTTSRTAVTSQDVNSMKDIHRSVINKISEDEIIEYYNRERESENKFSRILNIKEDRKLLSSLFPSRDEKSDRVTDQLRLKLNTSDIKTILVIGLDETNKKIKENNCNIAACNVIRDSKRFHEADVVVYKDVVPLLSKEYSRTQNQIITWFQIESALNYPFVTSKTILNWTATYRHDSVLNTPYERFTPFLNITTLPSKPQRNFARGKKKLVAWFVSNCGGRNQRLNYAKELQNYISVDIYGGCGPLKCNRKNKECFQKLKNDYKFYLAFENTNCVDYITEKLFWNAYLNDVVPIVMGAHPNDYKRSAPPRSFIHVDYFKSPKELASYLNYLDAHDDLYNSFFLWKGTGEFINTKFVCRLCAMAHLAPHFPMWYKNIRNWWSNDNLCETKVEGKYATWKHRQTPNTSVANKEIIYGYARK